MTNLTDWETLNRIRFCVISNVMDFGIFLGRIRDTFICAFLFACVIGSMIECISGFALCMAFIVRRKNEQSAGSVVSSISNITVVISRFCHLATAIYANLSVSIIQEISMTSSSTVAVSRVVGTVCLHAFFSTIAIFSDEISTVIKTFVRRRCSVLIEERTIRQTLS